MSNLIFNTELIKGAKGDTGDTGLSYEVPTGAVIAYDGAGVPEGYVETAEPLPPVEPTIPNWEINFSNGYASINRDGVFTTNSSYFNEKIFVGDNLTMYGKSKFEARFRIKTSATLQSGIAPILDNNTALCTNSIYFNYQNNDHKVDFVVKTTHTYSNLALQADTEYILYMLVENNTLTWVIYNSDGTTYDSGTKAVTLDYDNRTATWYVGSNNGQNKFIGSLYLTDSFVKFDDVLVWGTEPTE